MTEKSKVAVVPTPHPRPPSGGAGRAYAISSTQQRIWMAQQMNPASVLYVMGGTLRLTGDIDANLLSPAFDDVRRAHGILRSVFSEAGGVVVQRELPAEGLEPLLTVTDLSDWSEPLAEAERRIAARSQPVDLEKGPLFAAGLYRLGESEYLLNVRLHHIAGDGWSVRLLMDACRAAYECRASGLPPAPPPERQYRDFAAWQKKRAASGDDRKLRDYWREKLANPPEPLELPLDAPRPPRFDASGGEVRVQLPRALSDGIAARAGEWGVSPFALLTAALKAFLHRFTGSEDVIVGTVAAGREHPLTQGMIGCFVNTLPLRDPVRADMRFEELVRSVAETLSGALARQEYPYESMVEDCFPDRDRPRLPMLDVMAIWEDDEPETFDVFPGVRGEWLPPKSVQVKFDCAFLFRRVTGGGVEARVSYAAALWREETIRDFVSRLLLLLGAALADAAQPIARLPLMKAEERARLVDGWRTRETPLREEARRNGIASFEEWAARTPEAEALVCGDARLSYGELNALANRFARRLASPSIGFARGDRVGVLLPRRAEYAVSALAILKAGGVYVPLDPDNPPARLAELAAMHNFRRVITQGGLPAANAVGNGIDVDVLRRDSAGESSENLGLDIRPEDWMYIIHTSGSTGKPKAVAVPHSAAANLIDWVGRELYRDFGAPMREAVNAPFIFDVSIQQIFGSLSHGHACHLIDDATRRDLAAYDRYLRENRIDLVNLTPSHFEALLPVRGKDAWPIRVALVGAEVFPKRLLERFWSLPEQRGTVVYNMYGPTECCVDSTAERMEWPDAAGRAPSLGAPVDNCRMYVLDADFEPVPPGVAGELYISGEGLAVGYAGDPEKTAERFLPHPWRPGERMYRTGDRARWRPAGRLEFLGRFDAQLKIRGFRIEPGEIEARLAAMDGVTSAVVLAVKTPAGADELMAFVVAPENFDSGAARAALAGALPEYMVPRVILRLEQFPSTSSGKVDRRALADCGALRAGGAADGGPASEPPLPGVEEELAALWREVLGVGDVGRGDSFFALGGNSLQAMRLSARAGQRLGWNLPLSAIFAAPVLSDMARAVVTAASVENEAAATAAGEEGLHPLSEQQRRLWIMERMNPGSAAYSMPEALWLDGRLDAEVFLNAARKAVATHSALRTVFVDEGGEAKQRIRPAAEWRAEHRDVSGESDPEAAALTLAEGDRAEGFDLENGFPFRMTLVRVAAERHLLLVNAHHIVFDGGSLAPFVRALESFYDGAAADAAPQYRSFALWQKANLDSGAWEKQRLHWLARLTPTPEPLAVPADFPRPAVRRFRGARAGVRLAPAVWKRVEDAAAAAGANRFAACAALARLLLWRHSGQEDVLLGFPVSRRNRREFEGMVGYCVNNLALRIPAGREDTFASLLESTRREAVSALENADYPFDLLAGELPPRHDAGRSPLFDAMMVFEDEAATPETGFGGVRMAAAAFPAGGSRFDLAFIFRPLADGGMSLKIEYDSDLFSPERMARAAGHFAVLAEAAAADPARGIGSLDMLPPEEFAAVAGRFALGAVRSTAEEGIFQAVRAVAESAPDSVALWRPEGVKTYSRILRDAGRVARALRDAGAARGARVAVTLPRGAEVSVAVLGVLAAGCVHVPIDPATPPERRAALLRSTACPVELTPAFFADAVASSLPPLFDPAEPDDDAYIIHTSGSTGEPKGVVLGGTGFLGMIRDRIAAFGLGRRDRVLQFASSAFDASLWEIFLAWCSGASLAPVGRAEIEDVDAFLRFVNAGGVSFATLPPTYLRELAGRDWPGLRLLVTAGEAARPADAARWARLLAERGGRCVNAYGPTEASVCASTHWIPPDANGSRPVPIGRPVANTALWIVNAAGQPQPTGVPGELWIAGPPLAKGYLGKRELTDRAFVPVPEPLSEIAAAAGLSVPRAYRTGDLAFWNSDGDIEFVGRADWQVKIRGHRVELGEIEHSLLRTAGVEQACAAVRRDGAGGERLLAYVSAGAAFNETECLARLSRELPSYMIPSRIVRLEAMPLSVSGKIDRAALPEPPADDAADAGIPLEGERENCAAAVWTAVLGRSVSDRHSDFFRLGGDSIRAIQVVSKLKTEGWRATVADIFSHPVLAGFAATLVRAIDGPASGTDAGGARETAAGAHFLRLSPMQAWYFRTRAASDPGMAQDAWLAVAEGTPAEAVEKAWKSVWRRHSALRTRFVQSTEGRGGDGGLPTAEICAASNDARVETIAAASEEDVVRAAAAAREGLSPWACPLVRVLRFSGLPGGDRLYVVMHHLVVDGVSWRVLLGDIDECLRCAAAGKPLPDALPPALPWEYADAVGAWLTSPAAVAEDAFWRGRDSVVDGGASVSASPWLRRSVRLTRAETDIILAEPIRALGANAGEAVLAAAVRAWRRERLSVMVEGHGREGWGLALDGTVGWFTAMFPIVFDAGALNASALETLRSVKDGWRLVPRSGVGYAALRWLAGGTEWPAARPDMRFNYLGHIGGGEGSVLSLAAAPGGSAPVGAGSEEGAPDRPGLDFLTSIKDGVLHVEISADAALWDEERLSAWRDAFVGEVRELAAVLKTAPSGMATLSDRPWKGVAAEDWARLLGESGCAAGDVEAVHPLSPMQEGMLFHAQFEKRTAAYHEQFVYSIRGRFEPDRFRAAWNAFVKRHGMLRARFAWSGLSRPLAVVVRDAEPEWTSEDWRDAGAAARERRLAEWLEREKGREFSLSRDPLIRLALFRFGDGEWRFVWSHHHILMDGWCLGLARAETLALYRSGGSAEAVGLPPAPAYGSFIAWLETLDTEKMLDDWAGYLDGYSSAAGAPGKRGTALSGGARPGSAEQSLGSAATAALRRRAAEWGVSLNHCVEAAWALLLSRANRTDDVVFARVSSGRPASLPGADATIGLFINATPLRARVDGDKPFAELAAAMRRDWGWAEGRQYCSLAAIQARSPLGRNLLDSAVVFEQFPEQDGGSMPFTMEPVQAFEQAGYPCWLAAAPGEELHFRLHYDAALFHPDAMGRNVERLCAILEEAVSGDASGRSVSRLLAMPRAEWRRVSETFNDTEGAYPRNETVARLVAARVAEYPDRDAVECLGKTLSYAQLAALAAKVASALREAGVGEGDWVGVGLPRSERLPGVLLGIMSVGAAYVPLDPEFPESRLRHMATDAALAAVFIEPSNAEFLPSGVRRLTDADIDRQPASEWNPGSDLSSGDRLAYVLYTSGSTGMPKGVKLGMRGLVNFLSSMADEPGMGADDALLAVSSLAFDISELELLLPLVVGGKTVIAARNEAMDGLKLARRLARGDITMMQATPATWQMLFEAGWSGAPGLKALCGGEGLPRELADKLLAATAELWNMYGPTETTVWSTVTRVAPGADPIHLGKPIANTTVFILDAAGMPAGIDAPGELCIGGDGLAFGYHNRDELTAERFFLWTPPDGSSPRRLYRTGDLAFWRGDGNLGFLGREDFQVKIRGHRIELGDIEQALLELPGVRRSVAVAFGDAGSRSLAAYAVLDPGAAAPNWREALASRLPAYMIPSFVTVLPALPLTPNGKVDRKALPDPEARQSGAGEGEAPRDGAEAELASLWRDVLGARDIRREDDFFLLGGHSLTMARLAAAMRRRWGDAPELADMFRASTLAEMAALAKPETVGGGNGDAEGMTDEERLLLEGL